MRFITFFEVVSDNPPEVIREPLVTNLFTATLFCGVPARAILSFVFSLSLLSTRLFHADDFVTAVRFNFLVKKCLWYLMVWRGSGAPRVGVSLFGISLVLCKCSNGCGP